MARHAGARRRGGEPDRVALKLLEAHVPADLASEAEAALRAESLEVWASPGGRFGTIVHAVVGSERSGAILDRLHAELAQRGGLLVLIQPLDAVLPRPLATPAQEARSEARSAAAVSREEVYAQVADTARLSRSYLALVVLATLVAGIGLAHDNTAAVIGAMVVAPLLGPNMALALGTVLGDAPLIRRSLLTNAAGLGLALATAGLLGLALDADPSTPELVSRTRVGIWDLVLALAAGCAGALAYTTGLPTYLTGVMVAVALLPPAVASGIFLADGSGREALAALLLAAGNVTALILAATLTFLWRGLRPRNWWHEQRARRSARLGLAIFVALFAALAAVIALSRGFLSQP